MSYPNVIFLFFSYFLGCINTGYYYTRIAYKEDIRAIGTNVTGAVNVSRRAGKKGFIITFLGDSLKGAIVVALCRLFGFETTITMLGILFVITGHIFPLQLKFKGGKGISTAFGAYLTFQPILILYLLVICGVLLPSVRRYTITCLFSLLILPFLLFLTNCSWILIFFFLLYGILINYACKSNILEYLHKLT